MLETSRATPGFIFLSILYREDLVGLEEIKKQTNNLYPKFLEFSPTFNPLTEYYSKEMGPGLKRVFLVPTDLCPRETLLMTKLVALDWEREWSKEGRRFVNVDVGFLVPENFILATTKNYSHRIYLGQNIYADLTYQFSDGKFQTLPWTYPDYRDEEKIAFFTEIRTTLMEKIKSDA